MSEAGIRNCEARVTDMSVGFVLPMFSRHAVVVDAVHVFCWLNLRASGGVMTALNMVL